MSIQGKENENITKTQKKQQRKELLNIKHFNFRGGPVFTFSFTGGLPCALATQLVKSLTGRITTTKILIKFVVKFSLSKH